MSVSETASETTIAAASVMENSRNRRSTSPPMKRMETNTTMSATFMASSVKPTSPAPRMAARKGVKPRSMWRWMFSMTTMASSTTRPAATMSAISDRLFSENPYRYMMVKVPISDTGIATLGISAARRLPRNPSTTSTTRPAASSSVTCASRSVARMTGERSSTTFSSAEAGTSACNAGSWALMASMVSTMLAPGWRLTSMLTAGSLLWKPLE